MPDQRLIVATGERVFAVEVPSDAMTVPRGLGEARPTALTPDPDVPERAWCGVDGEGILRTEDAGRSWEPAGLGDEPVTALAASPTEPGLLWAGTEPSAVWRSGDAGDTWEPTTSLDTLPSSSQWSFPPQPDTHHVRWIGCHPADPGRLYVAIEAGALITTNDGGQTWRDRVPDGPYDTHELAIHPRAPELLRVAAGDGYFESADGGTTWTKPRQGLDVGYMRSVATDPGDPDAVVLSGASRAHAAYRAGSSDGRLYRRTGEGTWARVLEGWPDPPTTIAPVLAAGTRAGEFWAADERGLHRSDDGGQTWRLAAAFPELVRSVRALAVLAP